MVGVRSTAGLLGAGPAPKRKRGGKPRFCKMESKGQNILLARCGGPS